ncbi:MAG TPA: ABC transporter ATP-binding protein [Polyangiaceae bacterium]|jgi:ABC-type cobalamin/Fe3+-siderophores transport system ATPase subunit|nr:ABC transporter ATP-binding protein [Polyangiaceae bacterium]
MLMVELSEVSAKYRSGAPERLHGVDLRLRQGELCAVLGPNGAGKSTLLRVVAGVLAPTSGTVRLQGEPAESLSRQERARRVAIVPQRCEVALGFSVREVVAMGRAPHQDGMLRERKPDREAVESALSACGLDSLRHRRVEELSGGEQKRVHIARALAQRAPILLLDEAAADLDVRHAAALYALVIREVKERGLACLATMHDLNAAGRHADRIVLLKDGRVLADGPVDSVMTAERLESTFDATIDVIPLADGGRAFLAKAGAAEMST